MERGVRTPLGGLAGREAAKSGNDYILTLLH